MNWSLGGQSYARTSLICSPSQAFQVWCPHAAHGPRLRAKPLQSTSVAATIVPEAASLPILEPADPQHTGASSCVSTVIGSNNGDKGGGCLDGNGSGNRSHQAAHSIHDASGLAKPSPQTPGSSGPLAELGQADPASSRVLDPSPGAGTSTSGKTGSSKPHRGRAGTGSPTCGSCSGAKSSKSDSTNEGQTPSARRKSKSSSRGRGGGGASGGGRGGGAGPDKCGEGGAGASAAAAAAATRNPSSTAAASCGRSSGGQRDAAQSSSGSGGCASGSGASTGALTAGSNQRTCSAAPKVPLVSSAGTAAVRCAGTDGRNLRNQGGGSGTGAPGGRHGSNYLPLSASRGLEPGGQPRTSQAGPQVEPHRPRQEPAGRSTGADVSSSSSSSRSSNCQGSGSCGGTDEDTDDVGVSKRPRLADGEVGSPEASTSQAGSGAPRERRVGPSRAKRRWRPPVLPGRAARKHLHRMLFDTRQGSAPYPHNDQYGHQGQEAGGREDCDTGDERLAPSRVYVQSLRHVQYLCPALRHIPLAELQPRLAALAALLHLEPHASLQCVGVVPSLLCKGTEALARNLAHVARLLDGDDPAREAAARAPLLLVMPPERLTAVWELLQRELDVSGSATRRLLREWPQLLTQSPGLVRSKVEALREIYGMEYLERIGGSGGSGSGGGGGATGRVSGDQQVADGAAAAAAGGRCGDGAGATFVLGAGAGGRAGVVAPPPLGAPAGEPGPGPGPDGSPGGGQQRPGPWVGSSWPPQGQGPPHVLRPTATGDAAAGPIAPVAAGREAAAAAEVHGGAAAGAVAAEESDVAAPAALNTDNLGPPVRTDACISCEPTDGVGPPVDPPPHRHDSIVTAANPNPATPTPLQPSPASSTPHPPPTTTAPTTTATSPFCATVADRLRLAATRVTRHAVLGFPLLLTFSPAAMRDHYQGLVDIFGAKRVRLMLRRDPALLLHSPDRVAAKLWLLRSLLDCTAAPHAVHALVTRRPAILNRSAEALVRCVNGVSIWRLPRRAKVRLFFARPRLLLLPPAEVHGRCRWLRRLMLSNAYYHTALRRVPPAVLGVVLAALHDGWARLQYLADTEQEGEMRLTECVECGGEAFEARFPGFRAWLDWKVKVMGASNPWRGTYRIRGFERPTALGARVTTRKHGRLRRAQQQQQQQHLSRPQTAVPLVSVVLAEAGEVRSGGSVVMRPRRVVRQVVTHTAEVAAPAASAAAAAADAAAATAAATAAEDTDAAAAAAAVAASSSVAAAAATEAAAAATAQVSAAAAPAAAAAPNGLEELLNVAGGGHTATMAVSQEAPAAAASGEESTAPTAAAAPSAPDDSQPQPVVHVPGPGAEPSLQRSRPQRNEALMSVVLAEEVEVRSGGSVVMRPRRVVRQVVTHTAEVASAASAAAAAAEAAEATVKRLDDEPRITVAEWDETPAAAASAAAASARGTNAPHAVFPLQLPPAGDVPGSEAAAPPPAGTAAAPDKQVRADGTGPGSRMKAELPPPQSVARMAAVAVPRPVSSPAPARPPLPPVLPAGLMAATPVVAPLVQGLLPRPKRPSAAGKQAGTGAGADSEWR